MLKDTTREIEEMQNELWMKRTPQERARFASAMFAAARNAIIASLPKDLSRKGIQRQLYIEPTANICPPIFSKMRISQNKKAKIMKKFLSLFFRFVICFVCQSADGGSDDFAE